MDPDVLKHTVCKEVRKRELPQFLAVLNNGPKTSIKWFKGYRILRFDNTHKQNRMILEWFLAIVTKASFVIWRQKYKTD
uniref:Putative ovule protein n=1 Tax=Solanum chacoense TaxID=4108 RepID=A0A0V0HHS1_SOLCH